MLKKKHSSSDKKRKRSRSAERHDKDERKPAVTKLTVSVALCQHCAVFILLRHLLYVLIISGPALELIVEYRCRRKS